MIQFQNTLSGKKETFVPLDPKRKEVKMYSCGPTVYGFAHIGNFRSFLVSDLLYRVLQYAGYEVTKVQNITDVGHLTGDDTADASGEDKIEKKAREEKLDPFKISESYAESFFEDEKKLRIIAPQYRPWATKYIPQQIKMVEEMVANGYAYEVNGSVYFRTEKFKKYGALSKNKLEDLIVGARIEINDEKENPLDFALWKHADEKHLMQWESPWGRGFPGWHIECSAMSRELLGERFDIHTGGEDNIFPHHECEIAQNEACFSKELKEKSEKRGEAGGIKYWLHTKHLQVNGEKMSKSKGNFYTIRDLFAKGWKGNEIRFSLLTAHYRSTLNFTEEGLVQARASITRITEARRILREFLGNAPIKSSDRKASVQSQFQAALFDDLNVSDAIAVVFEGIKTLMKWRDDGTLTPDITQDFLNFLENDFNQIFDIFPEEVSLDADSVAAIEESIQARARARAQKNWAESDRIRDELREKYNVELLDEVNGTVWKTRY
jgi:cysteinyl-tRNA synthetase